MSSEFDTPNRGIPARSDVAFRIARGTVQAVKRFMSQSLPVQHFNTEFPHPECPLFRDGEVPILPIVTERENRRAGLRNLFHDHRLKGMVSRFAGRLNMFGLETPEPFHFETCGQTEAISRLLFLVEHADTMALLNGPDGCGRTTVLHQLAGELQHSGVRSVLINVAGLDDDAALHLVGSKLCLGFSSPMSRLQLLTAIREELSGRAQCGIITPILMDDVHLAELDGAFLRFLHATACAAGSVTLILASDGRRLRGLPDVSQIPVRLHPLNFSESASFVQAMMTDFGFSPDCIGTDEMQLVSQVTDGVPARIAQLCRVAAVYLEATQTTRLSMPGLEQISTELGWTVADTGLHSRIKLKLAQ